MKKVVRAIILNDRKVLLGKRAHNDAIGKWALIGGKPEAGETMEETIIREVKEELGVTFQPTFWMEEIDDSFGEGEPWKVSYFYGTVEGELRLKEEEVSEVGYFEEKDITNLDIAYDHKEILRKFFQEHL